MKYNTPKRDVGTPHFNRVGPGILSKVESRKELMPFILMVVPAILSTMLHRKLGRKLHSEGKWI